MENRRLYRSGITRRNEHGQSFIEFAFIVPFLFLMLIGVTVIAQGLNLQMALYGAAYEGARVWAKNPAGGDTTHCSPPACEAGSGRHNFETYVIPVVRQYVTNNGYDGSKVVFFTEKQDEYEEVLNTIARDRQKVEVTLLYAYELPVGIISEKFQRVLIGASWSMKRGG